MYLSRLVFDSTKGQVLRELGNAHAIHQRIMQGFPDEQRQNPRADWNILYRQEPDGYIILVQSDIRADWARLPQWCLAEVPQQKSVELEVGHFTPGRKFSFRLRANPSKRDKQTGKTVGYFRRADQIAWMERQAVNHGFEVFNVDSIPAQNVFGVKTKGAEPIRIHSPLLQGTLEVTDSALFLKALCQGIGRGRAYGCGLLSIAKFQ